MIFPFMRGLIWPRLAPATWLLVGLNILVFVVTYPAFVDNQDRFDRLLEEPGYLSVQGQLFTQLVRREPQLFSAVLGDAAARVAKGDPEARELMGTLALRNAQFAAFAADYKFDGDEVAIAAWRPVFAKIAALEADHPSFQWGLSFENASPQNWITYQFAHGGWMHLAINMGFLLIFGAFLEARVGSSLVVLTYLLSGIVGAYVFIKLTGLTASPLVGASASISGLGGLAAVHAWKEKIRYFYIVFPQPGYMGFAALPASLILLFFAVPDLAGYLASDPDVSSIAFTAHLGGTACGAAIAGLLHAGLLLADPFDPQRGWGASAAK